MKKFLIRATILIVVALAAMEGLYLLLRRAHNARQSEPTSSPALIAEVNAETADTIAVLPDSAHETRAIGEMPSLEPIGEEPTGEPPRFEDLPKEAQESFLRSRDKMMSRMYANRFKMTEEEWKTLSKKEQRLLIRKGTKQ